MRSCCFALAVLVACSTSPTTSSVTAPSTTPSITTNAATYAPGAAIEVSWFRLPGNAHDWIAIAPAGSAPSTVTQWVYTAGAIDGTASFAIATQGSYVARAFADDGYELLDESAAFDVVAVGGVTTDQPSYAAGASITVSWSALPGNQHDWIALAPAGSDTSSVIRYVYTNGAASGSHVFAGLAPGNYVARGFLDDTYTLLSESAFAVTGVTVAHDRAGYVAGASITITWSGLPGTPTDWIGLAPEGSSATTVTAWAYTGGAANGSRVFTLGASGRFVARAFPSDSYDIAGESSPFTNGLTITTDLAGYESGDPVTVTWAQLPGNAHDWIAIAPQGAPATTVTAWVYTNGAAAGSTAFMPANGTYVARAYFDDSYDVLIEGAPFVVGIGPQPPQGTIAVAIAPVGWGQNIRASWSSFPTNPKDWIALAPAGSPASTITQWVYTGGAPSGTHTFTGGAPTPGNYVLRGFLNDTTEIIAESAPFVVQERCVQLGPNTPQPGDEEFTGVGNPQPIVISPLQNGTSKTMLCLEEATSLTVGGNGLVALSAPRLRTLTGNLDIQRTGSLSLPRLISIGGDMLMNFAMDASNITLPALTSLRGLDVRVGSLTMPALTTVQGPVLAQVTALDLGLLTLIPNNLQVSHQVLANGGTVSAVELTRITGNATLTVKLAPNFPKLQRIDGDATIRAEEIVLPSLTYMFSFFSNGSVTAQPVLHKLLMPSIQRVENIFHVQSNPMLPACQVNAIIAQLSPPPNLVTVGSNDGTCPP